MTENNNNSIGNNIRAARLKIIDPDTKKPITQERLGKRMGFDDGTYISFWENDTRRPNLDNIQMLAKELNTTVEFLLTGVLTPTHNDVKLPSLINILRYELDAAENRYKLNSRKSHILEVPVMRIDTTIPRPFLVPTNGTVQIPDSVLATIDQRVVKGSVLGIEIETDIGNEFNIYKGDKVILQLNPEEIDGALYLITYQGIMLYRNITWRPLTLIDAREIRTPAQKRFLEMSGRVIKIWRDNEPKFYKPQP